MATKTLKQIRTFNAPAKDLYEVLMDSHKHTKLTGGAPAKISAKVGGKFTAYGGELEGEMIELMPNKKIVQSWRSKSWEPGVYSRATFSFSPAGKGKTKLTFTQSGIPESDFEDIKKGWISFYWEPMAKMLEK
jgi:activator of HSP90 ATPase